MAKYLQCAAKCRTLIRTLLARFLLCGSPNAVERPTTWTVSKFSSARSRKHGECRVVTASLGAPAPGGLPIQRRGRIGPQKGSSLLGCREFPAIIPEPGACAQRWNHFA